jgi:hypothetical protein
MIPAAVRDGALDLNPNITEPPTVRVSTGSITVAASEV